MPQPVYATGPQVKTDECQRIVTSLVTLQCMNANNCIGVELGDIRPAIMLQLSRMTGGNYATACAGYLDGIFNDYVSQFANAAPNGTPSKFPTPVAPNTNANGNQIQLSNPFATPAPDWATDMRERKLELQALHTETGTNNHQIQSAEFPATYADVSFTDRLENARNGYEPFKDARAYREMDIEDEETYLARIERSKPTKKCTEKTCNIDYVLNGGTNHNENPDEFTTCGNPVTLRSPTKTANTFDAWYTDQNFASDKKITKIEDKHCTTNNGTIKIYAHWANNNIPIICDNSWTANEHTAEEDQNGKYAILVQPYQAKQWQNTEYKTNNNNSKTWWKPGCAPTSIDSDQLPNGNRDTLPLNTWLQANRDKDPNYIYKYWLSFLDTAWGPRGIIMTQRGPATAPCIMKFTDLKDALCTANALATTFKDHRACTERQMHLYVVETDGKSITKIVGPDDTSGTDRKGDGYKAF